MMVAPKILFLTWQDQQSRRIVPIGRLLSADGAFYEFAYIRAVDEAISLGFKPLLSFPQFDTVYRSQELPQLLSNRLIRRSRIDYPGFIEQLGLAREEAEPFTVLARSGGRRATDRLEVFAPPALHGNRVEGLLLARGVRHIVDAETAIATLTVGEELAICPDSTNKTSAWAALLQDRSSRRVGYVPDYLARELSDLQICLASVRTTVYRLNPPPAPIDHRLLCNFVCAAESAAKMFCGERYRPISSSATDLAA